MIARPDIKPARPWFSSGPTAKRPGYRLGGLPQALLGRGIRAPEVVERMRAFGMEPLAGTPEQFHALARAEARRWGPIIAATGVKLD